MKRNSSLSDAIEFSNKSARQATLAVKEGVSKVTEGIIARKLKKAQAALSKSSICDESGQYYKNITFAELDMLIDRLKGATKYKALNIISSASNTEKKVLERAIVTIESLGLENTDYIIDAIVDNFYSRTSGQL